MIIPFYHTCMYRINLWGQFEWYLVAKREICVKDDACCDCQKCSDIKDYGQCVETKPCPDSRNNNTFCYWKPYYDQLSFPIPASNSAIPPIAWGSCDCCKTTLCQPGQYFDQQLCKCVCHPQYCVYPQIQDPDTCECTCPKKHDCGPLHVWNHCRCRCLCKKFICKPPRYADYNHCECKCPQIRCHPPHDVDPSSCECRCPRDITCPPGLHLDHTTCECMPWHIPFDGDRRPPT